MTNWVLPAGLDRQFASQVASYEASRVQLQLHVLAGTSGAVHTILPRCSTPHTHQQGLVPTSQRSSTIALLCKGAAFFYPSCCCCFVVCWGLGILCRRLWDRCKRLLVVLTEGCYAFC